MDTSPSELPYVTKPADAKSSPSASDVNRHVQNVLLLTLEPQNLSSQGPTTAVFLSSYREHMESPLFDMENISNPFFERMLMSPEALKASVVSNPTGRGLKQHGQADQPDIVAYLGECYIRLMKERRLDNLVGSEIVFRKLEELILQNLRLGFVEPDLVSPQDLPRQFVQFYYSQLDHYKQDVASFTQKFLAEPTRDFDNSSAANAILNVVLEQTKQLSLLKLTDSYDAVVHLVTTFSSHAETAKLLMQHSAPRNSRDAMAFQQSLLGNLLQISCLPEHKDRPCEYFTSAASPNFNHSDIPGEERFIANSTVRVTEAAFKIFDNIIRQSADLRETVLRWIADCLSANFGRAKIWRQQMAQQAHVRLASDGFIINLSAVLLRLCRPFVMPARNLKILRIDPLFSASNVYLRKLPEETTLLPKDPTLRVELPKEFGLITKCFFLCHEALRLGWRVVWEQFNELNHELREFQGVLEDARATRNVVLQNRVELAIRSKAPLHVALRAALSIPEHMELMIEFAVCTSTWLGQMAVQPPSSLLQLPSKYLQLFPLTAEVPEQLKFVPEFIVENILEILKYNHSLPTSTGRTTDWQYEWMVELMSVVLVYMPSPQRMKNPHLRAKMAQMMQNMMPSAHLMDKEHMDQSSILLLGLLDGHSERLFRDHLNKREFMPAILEVFVSIEMAGSNLRFGEAISYRRPLYALMEYLFTIPCHQQRVEELASEAVATLNAPTAPLFLRFLNLLINDSTFLLDEALSMLSKLKVMETQRDSWAALPEAQREERNREFSQQSQGARSCNILSKETTQCLSSLTKFSNPSRILLNNVMAERVAGMLNYFLNCLVNPEKRAQYKVQDLAEYSFNPKVLVATICSIYIHLGHHDARKDFLLAICQDGRSYSPQLFRETCEVLRRIGEPGQVIEDMANLARDVATEQAKKNDEEQLLTGVDVPDRYHDSILAHLMRDPVLLPSSGQIVDRSTIARILLSDQTDPFNRQPLTMDMVKPVDDLRNEIEAWIQSLRDNIK